MKHVSFRVLRSSKPNKHIHVPDYGTIFEVLCGESATTHRHITTYSFHDKNREPYIDEHGELIIPSDCPEKYNWWKNKSAAKGEKEYWRHSTDSQYLRIDQILEQLKVTQEVWEKYTYLPYRGPW